MESGYFHTLKHHSTYINLLVAIECFYDSEYESFFCYVDYPTLSNIVLVVPLGIFTSLTWTLFNDWKMSEKRFIWISKIRTKENQWKMRKFLKKWLIFFQTQDYGLWNFFLEAFLLNFWYNWENNMLWPCQTRPNQSHNLELTFWTYFFFLSSF